VIAVALAAVLAAACLAAWAVVCQRRLGAARARAATLAAAMVKLGHDLRGALSPAMLMSERLESNPDPAIRQAGTIVARALDRATALSQDASQLARDTNRPK
jgi:signal transduction histidine kinase